MSVLTQKDSCFHPGIKMENICLLGKCANNYATKPLAYMLTWLMCEWSSSAASTNGQKVYWLASIVRLKEECCVFVSGMWSQSDKSNYSCVWLLFILLKYIVVLCHWLECWLLYIFCLFVCLFFVASLKQVHRCRCITQYCGNRPRNSLWHIARLINFIPLQLQQNIKGDKTLIQSTTSWTQETDVARTLTRAD